LISKKYTTKSSNQKHGRHAAFEIRGSRENCPGKKATGIKQNPNLQISARNHKCPLSRRTALFCIVKLLLEGRHAERCKTSIATDIQIDQATMQILLHRINFNILPPAFQRKRMECSAGQINAELASSLLERR